MVDNVRRCPLGNADKHDGGKDKVAEKPKQVAHALERGVVAAFKIVRENMI